MCKGQSRVLEDMGMNATPMEDFELNRKKVLYPLRLKKINYLQKFLQIGW